MAAHVGLEIAEHRIQLVLLDMSDDLGSVLALSVLRLIMVSRVSLGDVDAGLLLLGRQRTLRALGSFVRLRVRRVGHRLMLMGAAIDLQRHVTVGFERKKRSPILHRSPREIVTEVVKKYTYLRDLKVDGPNFSRWITVGVKVGTKP